MTDLKVFEEDGRISEQAALFLPPYFFVRAEDTLGWKAAKLYRQDSIDHGVILNVTEKADLFTQVRWQWAVRAA